MEWRTRALVGATVDLQSKLYSKQHQRPEWDWESPENKTLQWGATHCKDLLYDANTCLLF